MCQASDALESCAPSERAAAPSRLAERSTTASSASDCRLRSARGAPRHGWRRKPEVDALGVLQRDRRRRRGVHRRLRRGRSPADVARWHRDQPRLRPHPADRQGDLPHPPPRRPHRGLAQLLHGELAAARRRRVRPRSGRPPHPVVSTRRRRAADLPRRAHTRNASGARPHAPGLRLQHQPPCRR